MTGVIITGIFLGVGLAMDACAVSMANGMQDSKMKVRKGLLIAGMFGIFQGLMPLIGYFLGAAILAKIEWLIPWIALGILGFIGGKMVIEGIKGEECDEETGCLCFKALLIQAFATSIDALSVGFTIADYTIIEAVVTASLVAVVTFGISMIGIKLGKLFGTKLGGKAMLLGGIVLIAIGIEIFISGIFF